MSKALSGQQQTTEYLLEFGEGEYIFREGEPGADMFIIESGDVEIVKSVGGAERPLAVLERGDFFGEMSILEDMPRGASARALRSCKVLRIDASTFDQMIHENPEIAVRMLRKLSRRLREALASAPPQVAPVSAEALPRMPPERLPPIPEIPSSAEALSPSFGEARAEVAVASVAEAKREEPAAVVEPPVAAASQAPEAEPAESVIPRGKLVHKESGTEFPLSADGQTTVGRFDPVTGIHPTIDLTALDTRRSTSRRHAKIIREGSRFYLLEEIGTANGTFLNNQRIKTGQRVEFRDGDEIRFSTVTTIFRAV